MEIYSSNRVTYTAYPHEYSVLSIFTRKVPRAELCSDVINKCACFVIVSLGYVSITSPLSACQH